jgi:RNA polymerase sigma factor (sigma-70 family)
VHETYHALDVAIERARAGDPAGFDALFRALAGSVAGYLRARSVSDPDGITNDVFLRVFRSIHTFNGDPERFRSWLFTIAHNAALDDVRRRRRHAQEAPLSRVPEQPGGDVEAEVMAKLAQERVHALLEELSPDQRDVLVLRIVGDLSIEQIAAVLGKSYEAVRALQRRGLASVLRKISSHEAVRQ